MQSTLELCGTNQRSFSPFEGVTEAPVVLVATIGDPVDARAAGRNWVEVHPSDDPTFRANDWAMRSNRGVL